MNPNPPQGHEEIKDPKYSGSSNKYYSSSLYHDKDRNRDQEKYSSQHYSKQYSPERHSRNYSSLYNKKIYSYILLPKNYFQYVSKNYNELVQELKVKIKDISEIKCDYKIPNYSDNVFRLASTTIQSTSYAIQIVSDYLFREMKYTYPNMTFLKVSILIPNKVVGFIIGIEGRNINRIREKTRAKIEVFPANNDGEFRQIEISGNPRNISKASELIYEITYRYINFSSKAPREDRSYRDKDYRGMKRNSHDYKKEDSPRRHYRSRSRNSHHSSSLPKDKKYDGRRQMEEHGQVYYKDRRGDDKKYPSNNDDHYKNKNTLYRMRDKVSKDYHEDHRMYSNNYQKKGYSRNIHNSHSNSLHHSTYNNMNQNQNENIEEQPKNEKEENEEMMINSLNNSLNNSANQKDSENKSKREDAHYESAGELIEGMESLKNSDDEKNSMGMNENEILNSEFELKLKEGNPSKSEHGENSKCSLEIILYSDSINILKNYKSNLWIDLENKYHCSISKKEEKLNGQEISIINFTGTPEENSFALYYLQTILLSDTNLNKVSN